MSISKAEEFEIGQDFLDATYEEVETYRDALSKILRWANKNSQNESSQAGDSDIVVQGNGEDLFDALSNAGFEIEHDGTLLDSCLGFVGRLASKLSPTQRRALTDALLDMEIEERVEVKEHHSCTNFLEDKVCVTLWRPDSQFKGLSLLGHDVDLETARRVSNCLHAALREQQEREGE